MVPVPWLGNIRELQNAIEKLCVPCDLKIGSELVADTLDEYVCINLEGTERIDCMRKNHIFEVLKQCGNKKKLAAYATFGTAELARAITAAIGDSNTVLMANHGLVAVGPNVASAFAVAEEIELVAQIYYQTLTVGAPKFSPKNKWARPWRSSRPAGNSRFMGPSESPACPSPATCSNL